jgi:hypothetical protein
MIRRVFILIGGGTAALLLASCVFPLCPVAASGTLSVNIDYTGHFYVAVFDYARDAPNIQHYVIVMPESEAERATDGSIFYALQQWAGPDAPLINSKGEDISWALDYVYDAPEGYFEGKFEPGRYKLAVAFIAGPLSREEAGVAEDVTLYAGITGGIASAHYQEIEIEAGKTTDLTITLTDDNGWACPWLYVYNGRDFERRTEILRNVREPATEITPLGSVPVIDGVVTLKIAEEKQEITTIDELYLVVDGQRIPAQAAPDIAAKVAAQDGDVLILTAGTSYEFRFAVPHADQVLLSVSGFYVPVD